MNPVKSLPLFLFGIGNFALQLSDLPIVLGHILNRLTLRRLHFLNQGEQPADLPLFLGQLALVEGLALLEILHARVALAFGLLQLLGQGVQFRVQALVESLLCFQPVLQRNYNGVVPVALPPNADVRRLLLSVLVQLGSLDLFRWVFGLFCRHGLRADRYAIERVQIQAVHLEGDRVVVEVADRIFTFRLLPHEPKCELPQLPEILKTLDLPQLRYVVISQVYPLEFSVFAHFFQGLNGSYPVVTQHQDLQTLKHFKAPDLSNLVAAQVQVLQLVQGFNTLHRDQIVRAQVQVNQR